MKITTNASINKSHVRVLDNELIYSHGFDKDATKFLSGDIIKVTATSKSWTTITNFHGTAELNTENTFTPGARTLSWANPFEYTRYLFTNLSDAHNYSALLLDWGIRPNIKASERHYYRDHATFMIIPPKKEITFLIGFAAPQVERDNRTGGGVQIRLKNLPAQTITVQAKLQLEQSTSMDGSKAVKIFDFEKVYNTAMQDLEDYLDSPESNGLTIPQSVFTQEHKVYSTASEFFNTAELTKEEIGYSSDLLKQFDVRRYVKDKFNIISMEEVTDV